MALWGSGVRLPTAPPLKKRVYTKVWGSHASLVHRVHTHDGGFRIFDHFPALRIKPTQKNALLDQNGSEAGRV